MSRLQLLLGIAAAPGIIVAGLALIPAKYLTRFLVRRDLVQSLNIYYSIPVAANIAVFATVVLWRGPQQTEWILAVPLAWLAAANMIWGAIIVGQNAHLESGWDEETVEKARKAVGLPTEDAEGDIGG